MFDSVLAFGTLVVALERSADFRGVVSVPTFVVVGVVENALFWVVSVTLERTKNRFECLYIEFIYLVVVNFIFVVNLDTHHHFIKIFYFSFNS